MPRSTIVRLSMLWCSSLAVRDIVVRHSLIATFIVDRFVIVVVFGIPGDDVPKTSSVSQDLMTHE